MAKVIESEIVPLTLDHDGLLAFKKLEATLRPLVSGEYPEVELSRLIVDLATDYISCFPDILNQEGD